MAIKRSLKQPWISWVPSAVATGLLVIVASPGTLMAQDNAGKETSAHRDPIEIYKKAGITEQQEEKIRTLAVEFENGMAAKADQVLGLLHEMRQLSGMANLDEKRIINTQKEINRLQGEMSLERVQLLINIRRMLSAEQREKLVKQMEKSRSSKPDVKVESSAESKP